MTDDPLEEAFARGDRRSLEQAALRLLAGREHSRAELLRKLSPRTGEPALLEQVLDALERQGALSDARFVESYIDSRRRRGFGPRRIRRELGEKGVDRTLVGQLLDETDPDWDRALAEAARRKYGDRPPGDFRERARRARFLEYRGFAPERIRALLWGDD